MPTNKFSSARSTIDGIMPYAWAVVWFFPVFSLKFSLLAIWLFGLAVIIRAIILKPEIKRKQMIWLVLPGILFFWYLISFLFTPGPDQGWMPLEKKSSLLLIPFLMLLATNIKGIDLKWAMRGFMAALLVTGVHLLGRTAFLAISGADTDSFTYHGFVAPYHIGAIYYSWYLSIALVYLLFKKDDPLIAPYRIYLVAGFMILLMLAASKLFILMMIPLVIWKVISRPSILKNRVWAASIGAILLFIVSLPFLERMNELGSGSFKTVMSEKFEYDTPLNGVTLRLIQWRFGMEILDESGSWLTGTGPGNSQAQLNEKYMQHGIYTGNPQLGDSGYLNYNFHNQYVETIVGTGIPGLVILLGIMAAILIRKAKVYLFPLPVFIITAIFFLTESVLERQAGIVVFALLLSSIKPLSNPFYKIQISE